MTGLWADAIARSAEVEWKQALATERATMIEALEKIKPQLQRIAVEPAQVDERADATPASEPPVVPDTPVVCRGCGHQLEKKNRIADCAARRGPMKMQPVETYRASGRRCGI